MKLLACISAILAMILSNPMIGKAEGVKRPFSEFGYPRQTIVYGQQNGAVYFIKNDPLRDLSKSGFQLELVLSPLIDKNSSSIVIRIGDWPVVALPLLNTQDTIQVFVPLLKNMDSSGFIKLSVEPNLRYPNQDCIDLDQQTVWMSITENSYMQDITLAPSSTISNWSILDFLPTTQQILIPKKNFKEYAGSLAKIHFYMQTKQGKNLKIKFLEDCSVIDYHHALIVGKSQDVLPAIDKKFKIENSSKKQGVNIHTFEHLDSLSKKTLFLNSLIVTSDAPKQLDNLAEVLFGELSNSFLLGQSFNLLTKPTEEKTYHFSIKNSYSFKELGLGEDMISGKGRIRKNITLPEFISKPSLNTFSMSLSMVHKPVIAGEQAYLNVFLNNKLVQTYRLDESGRFDKKIMATKGQLGAGNYLGFEIIYIPEKGLCDPDSFDFYAQLLPSESLIEFQYHKQLAETIHTFPANFQSKPIQILYDFDLNLSDIEKLSQLMAIINIRDTKNLGYYLPEIVSIRDEKPLIQENAHWVLLSKSRNNWDEWTNGVGNIVFENESITYRSDELDRFHEFYTGGSLNYVQLFSQGPRKVLQFNLLSKEEGAFERLLDGFRDGFLTNTGNVMVANEKQYFFFDLRHSEIKNQTLDSKEKFESFWRNYRILIVSLLVFLSVVLLLYIYKKSRIAQKSIEDARE